MTTRRSPIAGAGTTWDDPLQRGAPGPHGTGPSSSGQHARHSLPIGRIAGVRVELHWSFLALLAVVVLADWGVGASAVFAGLAWLVILFGCVVVHEVAHCVVAQRRGGHVLGILLSPLGGMSRMDRMPTTATDEGLMAAAGPATSLALGGVALAIGITIGSSVFPPTLFAGSWWARIGWVNILLGAFNLLPALPMDGGRILRALLARRHSALEATRIAASVARVIAIALIAAGLFFDLWLVVIGVFVYLGSAGDLAAARYRANPGTGPRVRWGVWGFQGQGSQPQQTQWQPGPWQSPQSGPWQPSQPGQQWPPPQWPPPQWPPPQGPASQWQPDAQHRELPPGERSTPDNPALGPGR